MKSQIIVFNQKIADKWSIPPLQERSYSLYVARKREANKALSQ